MADPPPAGDRLDEAPPDPERRAAAERRLRRHRRIWLAAGALVVAGNAFTGWAWWLMWAIGAWGLGLMAHWLFVRSVYVDEAWADERTMEVRGDAYDLAHIQDIERRAQGKPDPRQRRRRPPARKPK